MLTMNDLPDPCRADIEHRCKLVMRFAVCIPPADFVVAFGLRHAARLEIEIPQDDALCLSEVCKDRTRLRLQHPIGATSCDVK